MPFGREYRNPSGVGALDGSYLLDKAGRDHRTWTPYINRLKQWRGLAMPTDKLAVHYHAALTLAGILLWTRP